MRPAGRCSRARSPRAAPASSTKNAPTEDSAVTRPVRRTVVAPGPAWQGRRRSRWAVIARIPCRTSIASRAPCAPPTRRAVEPARRRSPRARGAVRTTAAPCPTTVAAASIPSPTKEPARRLPRADRPALWGGVRRRPRLLRPELLCTSRIALGGACSAPEECVTYATCDGTMCVAKPGLDDNCGPYPPDRCLLGLSCDTTTMRCALPSEAACR